MVNELLEWNNGVRDDKGQQHLDWPSHWPLVALTIIVLDDSEWPQVHDPK